MTDTLATLTARAERRREPAQVLDDAAVLLTAAGFRLERSDTALDATRVGTRRTHESCSDSARPSTSPASGPPSSPP